LWEWNGSTLVQTGSGTAISGANQTGACGLDGDTVLIIDSGTPNELVAWDSDGDGTWTESAATELSYNISPSAHCTKLAENKVLVNGLNGQIQTFIYTDGVGFVSSGNVFSGQNVGTSQMAALNENRFVEFETTSTDTMRIYDFSSPNWSQTGNSLNISSAGGQYQPCGVNSSLFGHITTTGDRLDGYTFDETDMTAEGTNLSDPASLWNSFPRTCAKMDETHYVSTSWGEPNMGRIELTCGTD